MFDFDVHSDIIEVNSNDGEEFFYVHEDLLRQQFGDFGSMIDEAKRTTDKVSIKLDLSYGALRQCTEWLYGKPMKDKCDDCWLGAHLELYGYAHKHFLPEVDHKCANASIDAILDILVIHIGCNGADQIFGSTALTLSDVVSKLVTRNGKGAQMLVDVLVYKSFFPDDLINLMNRIKGMKSKPCFTAFFQKLSYALAARSFNAAVDDHEDYGTDPDPDFKSSHAYHTCKEGEKSCCGHEADSDST